MKSAVVRGLRRPVRAMLWRCVQWLAEEHVLSGVRVFALDEVGSSAECLDKVDRALALMGEHDPKRLRQMQELLAGIALTGLAGVYHGAHSPVLRLCLLDSAYVARSDTSAGMVAGTLVHEMTHQQLWDAGIRYSEAVRVRVERVCTSAEIGFVRKLPGEAALVRASFRRYAAPASTWTDGADEQRRASLFRHAEVSEWGARFSRWLFVDE